MCIMKIFYDKSKKIPEWYTTELYLLLHYYVHLFNAATDLGGAHNNLFLHGSDKSKLFLMAKV